MHLVCQCMCFLWIVPIEVGLRWEVEDGEDPNHSDTNSNAVLSIGIGPDYIWYCERYTYVNVA